MESVSKKTTLVPNRNSFNTYVKVSSMDFEAQNKLAKTFKSLHIPGNPLILANVYDGAATKKLLENNTTKAVATASYAIAATHGVQDDELTWEQNLASVRTIAKVALKFAIPLSVDIQDGYEDLEATIRSVIEVGAVGCNLEDVNSIDSSLRSKEDAVARIKTVLKVAKDIGVPEFVVNARTDILGFDDGTLEDAITRARAYLAAGATCAFVWGGMRGRGLRTEEVEGLVEALDGRLSIMMSLAPNILTIPELRKIGVSRISVGPGIFLTAMRAFGDQVAVMLSQ
ncbi:hypothetical protein H2198_008372 [Neophaeococcomyces mojaviensis]|uniref:Uncharacterized protein n=1 Tax=Neophaeococcomyces mojaviensis TaxID=3383035 RepID=A0ACC2ZXP6_9EURO|nr:hypothetical protein H2198_008372 [Knufia sp. JES_112]